MKIRNIIGLGGVSKEENPSAQLWGQRFALAMIIVAIWLPLQWYLERTHQIPISIARLSSWLVWLFFVAETTTLLVLVTNKSNYLLKNWMNCVIIIVGLPPIWSHTPLIAAIRGLQLLIMLRLLLPAWYTIAAILSRNRLGTTLIAAFIVTILWGVLMSVVEPNIHNPWDGIWWAWETVTTVGYGDMIPTSPMGRILAIMLMIMGVGLFSLLTANFSAYFIDKETEAIKKEEDELLNILQQIQIQLTEIQTRLKQLENQNQQ